MNHPYRIVGSFRRKDEKIETKKNLTEDEELTRPDFIQLQSVV